jgi:hypothetical protein
LLLVDNHYPSTKSGAKTMRDLALELVRHWPRLKNGHEVKVAAADDARLKGNRDLRES